MYVDTIAFVDPSIESTDVKALIRKAHDLIRDQGWVKGAYHDGPRHCIVGALLEAGDYSYDMPYMPDDVIKAANLLASVIGIKPQPDPFGDEFGDEPPRNHIVRTVECWNDRPRRSKRQVLCAMKKAYA